MWHRKTIRRGRGNRQIPTRTVLGAACGLSLGSAFGPVVGNGPTVRLYSDIFGRFDRISFELEYRNALK